MSVVGQVESFTQFAVERATLAPLEASASAIIKKRDGLYPRQVYSYHESQVPRSGA